MKNLIVRSTNDLQWFWWIARQKGSIVATALVCLLRFAVGVRALDRIQRIDRLMMIVGWCSRRFTAGRRRLSIIAWRLFRSCLWLLIRYAQFI